MQLPGTLLNQARKIKKNPPLPTPQKKQTKSKKKRNSLCFRELFEY